MVSFPSDEPERGALARQEHQQEHWTQVGGGHKKECKQLKAQKEAAGEAERERAESQQRAESGARAQGLVCALPECFQGAANGVALRPCASCLCRSYCCKEHQAEHWKMAVGGHKKECKQLKAEKEEAQQVAARQQQRPASGASSGSSQQRRQC